MATYTIGTQVVVTETFTLTSGGVATNTDPTTVTFRVKNPAGTVTAYVYNTAPEVSKTATGVYQLAITPATAGTYYWRVEGTGTVVASSEGTFQVSESAVLSDAALSWSYDSTQLDDNSVYQIRLEIGDNIAGRTITLSDAEIGYALSKEMNNWGAAARCCEMLARAFLSKADTRLGRSLTLTYTTQAQQFFDMAKRLRHRATAMNAPWVGGMSVADKQAYAENDSLVQPMFARDMQESPWAGSLSADVPDAAEDE